MPEADNVESLIQVACSHPPGSLERQRYLTKGIRLISSRLWRESVPYYQDALQQTWVFFCQNICEAGTGEAYNPKRGSVVTWLNYYLKRRLQDGFTQAQHQKITTASAYVRVERSGGEGEVVDPIEHLPAPDSIPPILEAVQAWASADATGELRQVCIEGHPQVNCQLLILRRLPPESSWQELATEFKVSVSTLSSFYQRQCLTRLRKFGAAEGYID
ncbi:MAG: hypothetical protein B0A82_14425 [Alkalinema sp. CACIAM 70d]|nr:MAG: hypothetical protein B0A82_14425 [Alkalinema sp. CACIAM 70d]